MARPALRREAVEYILTHHDLNMRRGLQVDEAIARRPVLSERQRSKAGITRACAGDCTDPGSLWLPDASTCFSSVKPELGKNQAYRLYSEEQFQLRSKLPKRRKMVVTRQAKIKPTKPNEAWSSDFVADQLSPCARMRTGWFYLTPPWTCSYRDC